MPLPLYDYRCPECDAEHEIRHAADDDSAVTCPSCGHVGMKKRFSPPPLRFKGEDFTRKARV